MAYNTSASNYNKMTHEQHIMNITDTYIGSDEQVERTARLLQFIEGKPRIYDDTITLPEGVERLFIEILSNSSDNVDRSRRMGIPIGDIRINMNSTMISIRNGGLPIPIELHPTEKVYAPQLIFGNLLTSSNYDKEVDRTGCGRNGYGAKLVNIFSNKFQVKVGDAERGVEYCQMWENGMKVCHPPILQPYGKGTCVNDGVNASIVSNIPSYVEISWELNFARFGYLEYPIEAMYLFQRHAADTSMMMKVPVYFNGTLLDYQNPVNYMKAIFPNSPNHLVLKTYGKDVQLDATGKPMVKGELPESELCIIDTPDCGIHISCVNGMMTPLGGVHLKNAYSAISTVVLEKINATAKRNAKGGSSGSATSKGNAKGSGGNTTSNVPTLTMKDVKQHISIILICHLKNPKFDAQTKMALKSPTPKFDIPESECKKLVNWQFVHRLYQTMSMKQEKLLGDKDGKKRKHVDVLKVKDANDAGTKNSHNCVLYLTEGKSATNYATYAISLIQNGRNIYGTYPMKGKPLNVMNANALQLAANEEIGDLKEVLGLREGVNYLDDKEFGTLRYGKVVIMADSDNDGKHIIGLILNIFHCRYPSLLAREFIFFLRTPILRATKGNVTEKFYTKSQFLQWKELPHIKPDITCNNKGIVDNSFGDDEAFGDFVTKGKGKSKWQIKYFKGLGTSTNEEIKEDQANPAVVRCFYDQHAPAYLQLAFHQKLAEQRKHWIAQYQEVLGVESLDIQPISNFINHEFIIFSLADIARSIPKFIDGLKTSQRKVIWAALQKWKRKNVSKSDEAKVSRFTAYTTDKTDYAHGEKSMEDTIIGMAQSFLGSNNLPYLTEDGQFGSRYEAGSDAASSRYISTRPQWWLKYVFREEDDAILTFNREEADEVEPENFYPIIPLALVNGALGIGTAWSTFICNHNPLEIVSAIKSLLVNPNQPIPFIKPWYRHFIGNIDVTITKKNASRSTNDTSGIIQDTSGSVNDTSSNDMILIVEDNEQIIEAINDTTVSQTQGSSSPTEPSVVSNDIGVDEEFILDEDEEHLSPGDRVSIVTEGKFYQIDPEVLIITELPITRSPAKYLEWLKFLQKTEKIKDHIDLCTSDKVLFIVVGFENPCIKSLRLQKKFGYGNMVLLENNDKPVRYASSSHIIAEFISRRLPKYHERKLSIVKKIDTEIMYNSDKVKILNALFTKQLTVENRLKSEIKDDLQRLELSSKIFNEMKIRSLSRSDIDKLNLKIQSLLEQRQNVIAISNEQMWLNDLIEFETEYKKHYKNEMIDPNEEQKFINLAMKDIGTGDIHANLKKLKAKKTRATKKKNQTIVG